MNQVSPHNIDAEKAVLGGAMKSSSVMDEVVSILPSEDLFYEPKHRTIYKEILGLYKKGEPIDIITVPDALGGRRLSEIGGDTFLADMCQFDGSTINPGYYAQIVRDRATMRAVIDTCREVSQLAQDDSVSVPEVIERLDNSIIALSESGSTKGARTMAQLSDDFSERILAGEPAYSRDDYLLTRVEDLNRRIVGFFRGDLIVVCAPPSGGKTSFALDSAFYNAAVAHKHVMYFAIDETQRSMIQRVYCSSTGLPQWRFSENCWTDDEMDSIDKTREFMQDAGQLIQVVDDARSLTDIRTHARRQSRKQGLDMIIVDYLQQVSAPRGGRYENRNLEMTEIVRQLKELAKELNISVVVVSQFSRKYEADAFQISKGNFPRPQMSWLRDSGTIEQEANLIIGMSVPAFILKAALGPDHERTKAEFAKNGPGIYDAELIIMKNKMGETGSVPCKFSGPRMQFFSETIRAQANKPVNQPEDLPF